MKVITTKLKRYKIVAYIVSIIFLPIRLPMMLLIILGEFSEKLLDVIDGVCWRTLDKIVKIFKFDEIARKQWGINKEKFK
ncbi:hypothetical protein EJM73_08345 [Clostridium botulinum]|uniref:hypothetical protein n=1 Tax=Clostridium botulinum TaxID=1491 RepID=UPI001375E63F|nr:hypothetical protein [Clostridium botulinum]NCI19909.1 hypothetical protein [Clostridium botulinum]NCI35671.1 hypothetical protein [Clostridium botulinum]NCI71804.1 hypothetical protein [Clostridium botulinum]NDI38720.1 hypothetical protein [Clostridium botulinum]